MKHAPCKGCGRRKPYCHSSCNDYWEWRKIVDKARSAEQEDSRVISVFAERSMHNAKYRQKISGTGANYRHK